MARNIVMDQLDPATVNGTTLFDEQSGPSYRVSWTDDNGAPFAAVFTPEDHDDPERVALLHIEHPELLDAIASRDHP